MIQANIFYLSKNNKYLFLDKDQEVDVRGEQLADKKGKGGGEMVADGLGGGSVGGGQIDEADEGEENSKVMSTITAVNNKALDLTNRYR